MKQLRDCYDQQDDATLVASALAGEREAFDNLLARYSSSVLRLCTALLGNTLEAQDIAQEASLQAFLGLARLQEPARFAAWYHAIAANLARSALRRRQRSLYTLSEDVTLTWRSHQYGERETVSRAKAAQNTPETARGYAPPTY